MTLKTQSSPGPAKRVLVFLHHFGGAARSWKWLVDDLGEEYDYLAVNLPGFGGPSPLAEYSIEAMGGFVADQLTMQFPGGAYSLIGHPMVGKITTAVVHRQKGDSDLHQHILIAPSPPTIERMPEKEKARMLIHTDENKL